MGVIQILKTKAQKKRIKAYRKRRKEAHRQIVPQDRMYELIDGNWSRFVVGYCMYRHSCLTLGLTVTHRCQDCTAYREGVFDEQKALLSS